MQSQSPDYLNIEELQKENNDLRLKLKNLRDSLRKSEDRYKNLVESANSIILRIDINGTIRFANNYTLGFFGYSCREMIGNHVKMILPAGSYSGIELSSLF